MERHHAPGCHKKLYPLWLPTTAMQVYPVLVHLLLAPSPPAGRVLRLQHSVAFTCCILQQAAVLLAASAQKPSVLSAATTIRWLQRRVCGVSWCPDSLFRCRQPSQCAQSIIWCRPMWGESRRLPFAVCSPTARLSCIVTRDLHMWSMRPC